eukprot:TRINITY_DN25867_c0_g1_i1.p1 TRINITY_DN25867_c0_g1~~TRINITY_DN25867_c0_g1_i1.p1  ORF type:complete len:511 (+),score=113.60 TRINITY_DN25867_c0_g1_i1:165-1697(+)
MAPKVARGPSRSLTRTDTMNALRREKGYIAYMRERLKRQTRVHQKRAIDGTDHPFPRLRVWVLSNYFEGALATLIVSNCIVIGWRAQVGEPSGAVEATIIQLLEHTFTAMFLIELTLRGIVYNWTMILLSENWLDIFLVAMGVFSLWIAAPLQMEVGFLRKLTVLRTLRLVRLGRAVKHRKEFQDMWSLMKGLTDSFETLFWTYVMIGCVLYFFAIIATYAIGREVDLELIASGKEQLKTCIEEADKLESEAEKIAKKTLCQDTIEALLLPEEMADYYFGNVMKSMLTLFQIMTLDSWTSIMRPLMVKQPWVAWFFVLFITVGAFVLMNLIVSVIVENAFETANQEQADLAQQLEAQRTEELEDLRRFFNAIDADESGMVSQEELHSALQDRHVRNKFRTLDMHPKDAYDLFDVLDDGDGELDIGEFTLGLRRFQGEAKAKDIVRLQRELKILKLSTEDMSHSMVMAKGRMTDVRRQLRQVSQDIEAFRRTMGRAKEAIKLAAKSQRLTQ